VGGIAHVRNTSTPPVALEFQVSCGPEPVDDSDGSVRYELHGLFFKGARDPYGKPAPGGARRNMPWTVVPLVADAIRVLERNVKGPLLFPTNPPWTIDKKSAPVEMQRGLTGLAGLL
jgi:hypothetical protein